MLGCRRSLCPALSAEDSVVLNPAPFGDALHCVSKVGVACEFAVPHPSDSGTGRDRPIDCEDCHVQSGKEDRRIADVTERVTHARTI